jgi:hypothetical protein
MQGVNRLRVHAKDKDARFLVLKEKWLKRLQAAGVRTRSGRFFRNAISASRGDVASWTETSSAGERRRRKPSRTTKWSSMIRMSCNPNLPLARLASGLLTRQGNGADTVAPLLSRPLRTNKVPLGTGRVPTCLAFAARSRRRHRPRRLRLCGPIGRPLQRCDEVAGPMSGMAGGRHRPRA